MAVSVPIIQNTSTGKCVNITFPFTGSTMGGLTDYMLGNVYTMVRNNQFGCYSGSDSSVSLVNGYRYYRCTDEDMNELNSNLVLTNKASSATNQWLTEMLVPKANTLNNNMFIHNKYSPFFTLVS